MRENRRWTLRQNNVDASFFAEKIIGLLVIAVIVSLRMGR